MQAKSLNLPVNSIHNLHHQETHNLKELEALELANLSLLEACKKICGGINELLSSGVANTVDMKSLRVGANLVFGVTEQIKARMEQPSNERLASYAKAGR